jgi:hypothetical protein
MFNNLFSTFAFPLYQKLRSSFWLSILLIQGLCQNEETPVHPAEHEKNRLILIC